MKVQIVSMKEMAQGIWYNGVKDDEVSFTIRDTEYRYKPDDAHKDINEWDKEIQSQVGEYGKTGTALNFVKNTSSSYRKIESAEKRECTTTADMDLELVDTTEYDKSHDDDRINDKSKYDKDRKVIK